LKQRKRKAAKVNVKATKISVKPHRIKLHEKLMALHQHAAKLSSATQIEKVAKYTLDAMEYALGFDYGDFTTVENGWLRKKGSRGMKIVYSDLPLNGPGIIVKAARMRDTVSVSDTRKEPAYVDRMGINWKGPRTMLSELAVPVVVDEESAAVLNVENARPNTFTDEDRNLLEILASHVGSAYKRLNYEGKLIALHKHAQQLASATSLEEIIKCTLDAIESPLGVELADFYVIDTEKECLRLVGLRGWSPSFSELSLRGPGFTVMAANSQQTVRIPNISKEEGYVDSAGRSGKAVSTTRLSELAVPVIVEGKTVAVLNVESSQLNAFNDEDQRLLETLAVHVGSALGRLRHEEELETLARFPSENPDPILRLDRHGTVLFANEASKALLQDWNSGIGQAAPKPWRDLVTDVLSFGEGRNIDIELGGKSYTFLVKPIVEGDYVNLYGADITERKRMEKELRQSEERFRLITENMPGSVYLMDMNLKPTYISPNNTRVRGYTLEELYALPLDRQLTPDSLKLALENFKKALSEENLKSKDARTSLTEELEFYRKDGSTFWSENTFSFVRNSKGEPVGILGVGRDITARKWAEEKLRQSVERYQSLFDRMLDGTYRSTHEGRFVDINPAFVKMFGYSSKQEMLDITDIKKQLYFSPEERGSHILDTGQEEVEAYRMRRKDGSEIWVEDHGGYVHDERGKIIFHEGLLRNVTERVRAEEALRQHARELEALQAIVLDITRRQDLPTMLRAIVEQAATLLRTPSGGLYTCNPERQMVRCVVSYNTLKDYTGTSLMFGEGAAGTVASTGQPLIIDDYHSWSARAGVFEEDQPFGALLSVPMIWEGQVTGVIHVLDKESRHFTKADLALLKLFANHAAIALENARHSENLERMVGERTAKLAESQHQLQLMADSLPAAISYVDSQQRYSFNNKTYKEWFGKSPNEIVGRHVREILGEQTYQRIHGRMEAALSGEGQFFEYELTLRSGTRYLSATYVPNFGEDGQVKGVFVLGIDITERKRMEERLLKAQRFAAIGETAAMVGHDLRNPLQAISAAAYVLEKKLSSEADLQTREMLEAVKNSVAYSDKIVEDLLEYSEEIRLERSETTLKSLAGDALLNVRIPRNISVSNLTSDEPKIRVDAAKIRRVFSNLIENAVDSMPNGGKLTIISNKSNSQVELKFMDTGVGIPEHVLRELWTPLITTKPKGIGLGLAICKRIAEAHGGSISVTTKKDEGTTLILKLPLTANQEEGRSA